MIEQLARKFSLLCGLFLVGVFLILVSPLLFGELAFGESFVVDDLIIEGSRQVDVAAIRVQIKNAKGKVTREMISTDIKTLYNSGFFDQVSVSVVSQSDGTVVLKYVLAEKPIVRKIFIRGNKEVTESDLSDVLQFTGKRFLDRGRLDGIIANAVAYYQSQGFYDATVEASVTPVGENQVDVTFNVVEGERYRINKVSITGLSEVDEDDLLSTIQTKRYKWWSSWIMGTGRLSNDMLQNDKQLVRQFLLDHGYVDGTVSDALIEKKSDGLLVSFNVVEGPQYEIGTIAASGDLIDGSVDTTLDGIEIESGEIFSASALREDSFKISEKFTDIGYAFANVVPDTDIQRETKRVNLNFVVSKGKVVKVDRINISGNSKTYDRIIRRELTISEQEMYSGSKVKRSQALLNRLGYFEEATITTAPSQVADAVDLDVNVREGSTGSFSAGVGYSSSDGALFNARLSEDNLWGEGLKLTLNVDQGTEVKNYILSLTNPRIYDTYVSWGMDLLRTDREFQDFDRALTGASTLLGYPLERIFGERFEDISASVKYEYLDIDISDVDPEDAAPLVINSKGTSTSSSITPRITRNTINNPLNPSSGSRQSVGIELAGAGGSENFFLLEARNQWYTPLIKSARGDLVFSWRTSVAYGESMDDDPFPLFRRFFPGGINSVRGYKNRTLGPQDINGNEYGGSKEAVNNLELIFPIVNSAGLRGVVFYDAGQAFDDNVSMEISELRLAWGYGIRWTSPLGPIRVEFGYPVDRQPGEDSVVTMFSFGAPI